MSANKTEKTGTDHIPSRNRAAEIANTFEWLITAFMLAFVTQAFLMQAFRIPTGSMADTLMGSHFRLRCSQCGYEYNRGFKPSSYGLSEDTVPLGEVRLPQSRCPSCGYDQLNGRKLSVAKGDRILVAKYIYQFFEPKRWDVVVFKAPLDPKTNFIKRLIGRSGEKVEIIDGDVYINGQIARKPPKIQEELWMPVYDNDYQPARPMDGTFNGHTWKQPFDVDNSEWRICENNPTKFELDSPAEQRCTLCYDSSIGNDFKTTYAYNNTRTYGRMPYCSDLLTRFYAVFGKSEGHVGVSMSKYQTHYKAWVEASGKMVIVKIFDGNETSLVFKDIKQPVINKPLLVRFSNVDHRLVFEFGEEKLVYDLDRLPNNAGQRRPDIKPEVEIFGSGEITLLHVAIFRDIHYNTAVETGRATEGNPFTLGKDEFFVLGDNSPDSGDSRVWDNLGKGNNNRFFRQGIVPREYLVGKAVFVYWPSGFLPLWPESLRTFLLKRSQHSNLCRAMYTIVSLKSIPNISRMRFIYGGSNKKP